ncbi:thioesterase II family protein [Nonomuraea sp. NPDC052265]|uniref:thioesterase II family protein n=1 Tax=Nonomuraea sp. NPDC052265 TaxID=3364374 RepID=UPI0037CA37E9
MSPAGPASTSRWTVRTGGDASTRLRLLCFPHVGAGAVTFRSWTDHLPADVELCAVRLPGRENRMAEPLIDDADPLFAAMEPALAPLLDRPFVLVGHCSGSVLAYEFARRLGSSGGPVPRLLVLSSTEAPAQRRIDDPLHLLPSDALRARVIQFGGMPQAVVDDPDLMRLFERVLRADYRLVERLVYSPGPPLETPIAVIGGRHDDHVSCAAMAAWCQETSKDFTLHVLEAGHYLVHEAGELVGRLARQLLEDR